MMMEESAISMPGPCLTGCKKVVWMPDAAARNCRICNLPFNLFRRRHHCRACGKVVCHKCSPRKVLLPLRVIARRLGDLRRRSQCSILFCGYLHKRARKSGRNWRRRWFELYRDRLLYYKSADAEAPRGSFPLTSDCTVRPLTVSDSLWKSNSRRSSGSVAGHLCLVLVTPKDGLLFARADSEHGIAAWLEAINTVLTLLNGGNRDTSCDDSIECDESGNPTLRDDDIVGELSRIEEGDSGEDTDFHRNFCMKTSNSSLAVPITNETTFEVVGTQGKVKHDLNNQKIDRPIARRRSSQIVMGESQNENMCQNNRYIDSLPANACLYNSLDIEDDQNISCENNSQHSLCTKPRDVDSNLKFQGLIESKEDIPSQSLQNFDSISNHLENLEPHRCCVDCEGSILDRLRTL